MTTLINRAGLAETTGLHPMLLEVLLYLIKAPTLEKAYEQIEAKHGLDLIEGALAHFNIDVDLPAGSLDQIPDDGPFLTVSNHPFGFLDGIILLLLIGRKRPEFKVTANFILSYFAPISHLFICVNPFEKGGPRQLRGSSQVKQQLELGHGVGLFPAGEVSTRYAGSKEVLDKDWSLSAMKLIQRSQVPVIPIYFDGENSRSFHTLGKLHPMLRTARIPAEFLKKNNSTISLRFGERIDSRELQSLSPEQMQIALRQSVYQLKALCADAQIDEAAVI
jgi:putative hemolysin